MPIDDTRLRKLKFRAWHRGFREADLILGPFADTHAQELSPQDLDLFEVLLEQPDHDLNEWIMERADIPAEFDGALLNQIKAFRFKVHEIRGDEHGG
ncbi:MAG: succinate dehydrogenase assembly factor 2 [Pseudomonadota bacterium]